MCLDGDELGRGSATRHDTEYASTDGRGVHALAVTDNVADDIMAAGERRVRTARVASFALKQVGPIARRTRVSG